MSYRTTRAFERQPATPPDYQITWLVFCRGFKGTVNAKHVLAFHAAMAFLAGK